MTIDEMPYRMIICLLCTILIETGIAIIIGIRNKKDILNVVLVNVLTNPLVASIPVYFNVWYSLEARNISLCILEVLTLFTEGFIYSKVLSYKKIKPLLISIILNASSYLIGEVINYFI